MASPHNHKAYLGDGVYADFDGNAVVLTTEQGLGLATNTIVLEGEVISSFNSYVERLKATLKAQREKT